jgi:DNA-binding MarR family transcriptional regulator
MDAIKTSKLLRPLEVALKATSHDLTVRQLCLFLHIAKAGKAGTEQATLARATGVSQAAVSRSLKLFVTELGIAQFFLEPTDGRFRLVSLTDKGQALLKTMTNGL